jgi:hypothetical protein
MMVSVTDIARSAVPIPTSVVIPGQIQIRCYDKDTSWTTGTDIIGDQWVPFNATVTAVRATCDIAGTTGVSTIDINIGGATILSTKLTIDSAETDSDTAATAPVISDTTIVAKEAITIDVDGTATTPPKGLVVLINYERTVTL